MEKLESLGESWRNIEVEPQELGGRSRRAKQRLFLVEQHSQEKTQMLETLVIIELEN